MRRLHRLTLLPLLLCSLLASAAALGQGLYQVEVIVFRQAGEPLPASQLAPDDWSLAAVPMQSSERATALNGEAARLTPNNGYQVLLHKAWSQNLSSQPSSVALSGGNEQFGHYPVEGTLSLTRNRFIDVEADLWINAFDDSGLLNSSERLKQGGRLKSGELTYLDHGSLGLLIRVSPL